MVEHFFPILLFILIIMNNNNNNNAIMRAMGLRGKMRYGLAQLMRRDADRDA